MSRRWAKLYREVIRHESKDARVLKNYLGEFREECGRYWLQHQDSLYPPKHPIFILIQAQLEKVKNLNKDLELIQALEWLTESAGENE